VISEHEHKHRLMLMAAYSPGLRASEVLALRAEHIDSQQMLIKVVAGKGQKDRYTILSHRFLDGLRQYYHGRQPKGYLFPSSLETLIASQLMLIYSQIVKSQQRLCRHWGS
jgi:site-specific recombinase XerD